MTDRMVADHIKVAPFTGAWIETLESLPKSLFSEASRALHGRVD